MLRLATIYAASVEVGTCGGWRRIAVKGWDAFQGVTWASDGKGLFVSSPVPEGSALLHVDLKGNAHVLWEQKGSVALWNGPWDVSMGISFASWAVPSPDGRH